ncbi:MAG: SDR family oxidoreductase [Vicinamibacterales bacterium]|nr:SDR family oxidoreductase [Vicinamibacterales bacterium]
MRPLEGKAAIVTGASRGIGRAIALKLAALGARCAICARDEGRLGEVVREITNAGGTAEAMALDLREPEAPSRVADFCLSRFERIDIVVNNAGATKRGEFLTLSDADFSDGFALKYFGSVRLVRAAWPHLKASGGSVVNIVGVGGRTPGAQFAIGGSVNAALLSLTKSLAASGIADGVQVNAVSPGAVRTDRLKNRLQQAASEGGGDVAAAEKHFVTAEKITRIGEPEDIAGLVAFVVGPEGRFLQGALIDMDGGATKTI